MRGNSLHGNRETQETPAPQSVGRAEKANRRTSDTHVSRESGRSHSTKEAGEQRWIVIGGARGGKGIDQGKRRANPTRAGHSAGKRCGGWRGVREAAKRDQKMRFTALLHHITPQMLRDSYFELKRMAAPGVDGVTWHGYGRNLEERIDNLHRRIHRGAYRAQPSKRAWIPKADGRQRPLGEESTASIIDTSSLTPTTRPRPPPTTQRGVSPEADLHGDSRGIAAPDDARAALERSAEPLRHHVRGPLA